MRSDVSFDGDWIVYLAMGANGDTWNAVSQLPRLTAEVDSANRGTWNGGGYWRTRDILCLNRWEASNGPHARLRSLAPPERARS